MVELKTFKELWTFAKNCGDNTKVIPLSLIKKETSKWIKYWNKQVVSNRKDFNKLIKESEELTNIDLNCLRNLQEEITDREARIDTLKFIFNIEGKDIK